MEKKILLLIPAYNEENNIRRVIRSYRESKTDAYTDMLVVDDGSCDRTAEMAEREGITVITQIYNMGYGAALQTGYKYAVNKGYEYVIQMDADGQHDISNIQRILIRLAEKGEDGNSPDIVIGSRYLKESISFPMSALRMAAVRLFRLAIRAAAKQKISDPTSGLQGLSRSAFSYYAGFNQFDVRYPDINMLVQMLLLGYRVVEVPAVMHERTEGQAMHKGAVKLIKYMVLMILGTLNAMTRYYGVFRKRKKTGIQSNE